MASRPVLSMNFYEIKAGDPNNLLNFSPYQEIKRQAKYQNQHRAQRIQQKKKNANKVLQNINDKISHFFPEQKNQKQTKNNQNQKGNQFSFSQSSITQRNRTDKKYNKSYFDSLHQNLKDINELINALDIDS